MNDKENEHQIWLQSVGTVGDDWVITNAEVLVKHVWNTRHPRSWDAGDLIVYYASMAGRVVGVVEITGEDKKIGEGRWKWETPIRPLLLLDVQVAPLLSDAGLKPQVEHKRLTREEYARICDLLANGVQEV